LLILNFVQREVRLSAIALLSLAVLFFHALIALSLALSLPLFFVEELSKGCEEFRGFVTRAVVAKKITQGIYIYFFLFRCSSRLICRCSLRLRKKKEEEEEEGEGDKQEQESEEVP
jgi:hypothetical protein